MSVKNIVKFQATKGESVKGILASNATSYTKTTRTTLVVSFTHLSPLMVMVVESSMLQSLFRVPGSANLH